MPRAIPASLQAALNTPESGEALLAFLTISHPMLTDDVRLVTDGVDYTRDSLAWTACAFDYTLLPDGESAPRTQISIQNVDRSIGERVRAVTGPVRLKLELLYSGDFDQSVDPRTEIGTARVAYVADYLYLTNVSVDAMQVSGDVVGWDYTQERGPFRRTTPERTPGLYK